MIRLALIAVLVLLLTPAPVDAKRTGLIRVFTTTVRESSSDGTHTVLKRVKDRRGRSIGEIGQACFDVPGGRQECVGTLRMPLGRIMYQGSRRNAAYYVLAVVGGTGIYSGSHGQFQARTIATGPRVEYLLLSLVP